MGVVVAAITSSSMQRVALKFLLPEALGNAEVVERFARRREPRRRSRASTWRASSTWGRCRTARRTWSWSTWRARTSLDGSRKRSAAPRSGRRLRPAGLRRRRRRARPRHHSPRPQAGEPLLRPAPDGQLSIKVLDFGISKMTDASGLRSGSVTRTSALMGSPLYMSPEQLRSSRDVKAQTDIWALGVILFELMTGRAPFVAESVPELGDPAARRTSPSRTSARRPRGLEAVIFKCLEKEPKRRFQRGRAGLGALPLRAAAERSLGRAHRPCAGHPGRPAAGAPREDHRDRGRAGGEAHLERRGPGDRADELAVVAPRRRRAGGKRQAGAPSRSSPGLRRALRGGTRLGLAGGASARCVGVGLQHLLFAAASVGRARHLRSAASATPADTAGAAAGAASGSTSGATDAPPSASTAPPSIASAPAPIAPATATAATAAPPPVRAPVATPKAPAPPAAPATPTCHMVSFFDSDGNKRFKRECK